MTTSLELLYVSISRWLPELSSVRGSRFRFFLGGDFSPPEISALVQRGLISTKTKVAGGGLGGVGGRRAAGMIGKAGERGRLQGTDRTCCTLPCAGDFGRVKTTKVLEGF